MVDIGARTKGEIIFTIVLIIESAIVNAIIYGQFAILTEQLQRE